jgi:7-cyano-7-deazaguanine synthase
MRKAFVLLSGGLDSTTCLYKAIRDFTPEGYQPSRKIEIPWVEAISIDYGQRHKKEMEYAKRTCSHLGIDHHVLNLAGILAGPGVMLTDSDQQLPDVSYDELPHGVSPTYVPFRNGTLLSMITAHAQKWVNDQMQEMQDGVIATAVSEAGIYFGAHAEDAHNWAYPDCTPEFIGAMANAIYIGTYHSVRLFTPLMWLKKHEIVTLGNDLGVPFGGTWSCYAGGEKHCGTCPTCRSRKDAFMKAMVEDPTEYAA